MSPAERRSIPGVAPPAALLAAALLALPGPAPAQTLDGQEVTERLRVLTADNASRYLRPVSSGLGAGLNTGYFNPSDGDGGIDVQAGLQVSGSFVPDDADVFEPVLPNTATFRDRTFEDPYVLRDGRTTTPTATGDGSGVTLEPSPELREAIVAAGRDPANFEIRFPDGVDLPAVPLAMAEASVGLPTGTGLTVRFLPEIDINEDVGQLSSYGFGLRQSISAFLGDPPVEAAVALGYQSLTLGDVADASAKSASLLVSRDLGLITVYGAGGIEDSSVEVDFTLESPTDLPGRPAAGSEISFENDGANSGRFTGGVRLDLFVARLSVSYTEADFDVLQARLTFGT